MINQVTPQPWNSRAGMMCRKWAHAFFADDDSFKRSAPHPAPRRGTFEGSLVLAVVLATGTITVVFMVSTIVGLLERDDEPGLIIVRSVMGTGALIILGLLLWAFAGTVLSAFLVGRCCPALRPQLRASGQVLLHGVSIGAAIGVAVSVMGPVMGYAGVPLNPSDPDLNAGGLGISSVLATSAVLGVIGLVIAVMIAPAYLLRRRGAALWMQAVYPAAFIGWVGIISWLVPPQAVLGGALADVRPRVLDDLEGMSRSAQVQEAATGDWQTALVVFTDQTSGLWLPSAWELCLISGALLLASGWTHARREVARRGSLVVPPTRALQVE